MFGFRELSSALPDVLNGHGFPCGSVLGTILNYKMDPKP